MSYHLSSILKKESSCESEPQTVPSKSFSATETGSSFSLHSAHQSLVDVNFF